MTPELKALVDKVHAAMHHDQEMFVHAAMLDAPDLPWLRQERAYSATVMAIAKGRRRR